MVDNVLPSSLLPSFPSSLPPPPSFPGPMYAAVARGGHTTPEQRAPAAAAADASSPRADQPLPLPEQAPAASAAAATDLELSEDDPLVQALSNPSGRLIALKIEASLRKFVESRSVSGLPRICSVLYSFIFHRRCASRPRTHQVTHAHTLQKSQTPASNHNKHSQPQTHAPAAAPHYRCPTSRTATTGC